jgi:DNA-binding NarL/FixJ family response regulator
VLESTELDQTEQKIFSLVAGGQSDVQIAELMGMSVGLVEMRHRILSRKLWSRVQRFD